MLVIEVVPPVIVVKCVDFPPPPLVCVDVPEVVIEVILVTPPVVNDVIVVTPPVVNDVIVVTPPVVNDVIVVTPPVNVV